MKPKYLIYGVLLLAITGVIFISHCVEEECSAEASNTTQPSGTLSISTDCASLEKELKMKFAELSKSCLVDNDCTHITVLTNCLAPCPTCVGKSKDIKLIGELQNKIHELECPVEMCAPKCPVITCRCLDNICQRVISE